MHSQLPFMCLGGQSDGVESCCIVALLRVNCCRGVFIANFNDAMEACHGNSP